MVDTLVSAVLVVDNNPWRLPSCWFALGPNARPQLDAYVTRYLSTFGADTAASMATICTITDGTRLREVARQIREAGADELLLVPTTNDPTELDRVADVLG